MFYLSWKRVHVLAVLLFSVYIYIFSVIYIFYRNFFLWSYIVFPFIANIYFGWYYFYVNINKKIANQKYCLFVQTPEWWCKFREVCVCISSVFDVHEWKNENIFHWFVQFDVMLVLHILRTGWLCIIYRCAHGSICIIYHRAHRCGTSLRMTECC